LIASDGVILYVGRFYRGAITNGKRTYPDGGVFEGRFHLGGRSKGIYTYPDGRVFEGEYTWFDVRPKGSRASTKGLLTFNSEDDLLDFEGDIMALDPDIDDRSGRRGKMRWKDGSSFDGKWVAGRFDDGTLRCREFLGHYPLAFREFFSCPLYNDWREGKYDGKFKDGELDGWGVICWLESWTSGSYPDMPSGKCSGTFKRGTLHGHIRWTKDDFWIRPSEDADIFFSGTAADGFIWPHVPSSMSPNGNDERWDWPRPPQAGLRFKMDSKVSVNTGDDEWETAYIKGFTTDECNEAVGYRVLLECDCHTVLVITDDNDDFTSAKSGPIVDGKPRGIGFLTVKYSKNNTFFQGLDRYYKGPPDSYDWEGDCEVEFGPDYVRGSSREYLLNVREDEVTGFYADPPSQLLWSRILLYDKRVKEDWHPLFGLIGSVLWNELSSDVVDNLEALFTEKKIAPVSWCDITFIGQEPKWEVGSKQCNPIELGWLASTK
ncbi:hypothetical protein THAOC_18165, partial [Thalassiosira oceanica]